MRFNNKTNIPNKVVQNIVNNLDKVDDLGRDLYTPLYSFADKYGNNSSTYRIPVSGFPDLMISRNDKYCDVTTVGNEEYYNVDKDGKRIMPKVVEAVDDKKKKKK